MNRIAQLTLCLALVCLSAYRAFSQTPPPPPPPKPLGGLRGDPVVTWQETRAEESNFKITLPGKPFISQQTVKSPLGKLPLRTFVLHSNLVIYTVLCGEYPIAFDTPSSARGSLDGARDLMLSQSAGKLLSEREISYGKFPGREWKALTNRGLVRARMYLVQNRLYALLATMPEAVDSQAAISAEVNRVFDSFQLLQEPTALPNGVVSIAQFKSSADSQNIFAQLRDRPQGWREFASPQNGFKLQLPSEPVERALQLNLNDPSLNIHLLAARSEKLICLVLTYRLKEGLDDAAFRELFFKDLLGGLSEGFAKSAKGEVKLLGQTPINLQGHPGQEYVLRLENANGVLGRGMGRSYVIGETIYALTGLALGASTEATEVTRFLDSFSIFNLPPPPSAESDKRFNSTVGNFSVTLPGIRTEGSLPLETPLGKVEMHFVTGETAAGSYSVIYADFSPAGAPEAFLDGVVEGLKKTQGVKLLLSKKTSFGNHPGRFVSLQLPTGQTTQESIHLVNWRLYHLRTVGATVPNATLTPNEFFDSFKLLQEPAETSPPPPPKPLPALREELIPPGAVRVSGGMLQGGLATKKVQPEYSPDAKAAGAQGPVSIQITLSETGQLLEAVVLDGHPLLRDSALVAARRWQFKPHKVDGKPVKAVGILTFQFILQ